MLVLPIFWFIFMPFNFGAGRISTFCLQTVRWLSKNQLSSAAPLEGAEEDGGLMAGGDGKGEDIRIQKLFGTSRNTYNRGPRIQILNGEKT